MIPGHFAEKAELHYDHFFLQPQSSTNVVVRAIELGVNAIQVIQYPRVAVAVREGTERSFTDLFLMGTVGLGSISRENQIVQYAAAEGVAIHRSLAHRDFPFSRQHMAPLREQRLVAGIAPPTDQG